MNNLQLIEGVVNYIDEHLTEEITFEKLADVFGYSPFHFHRIFTAVTGQSITDFLKKRRLSYALSDLVKTDHTITRICYDNGFNSVQSFNRLFKQNYNMSPSQARQTHLVSDWKSVQTILLGYQKRIHFKGEYIMEPRIVEKEAFVLAGVRKHTRDGWQVIGEAWCELKSQMDRLPRVDANVMYGFEDYSEEYQSDPLQYYYMAAVEVEENGNIPEGMYIKRVPKSSYAVFTVNGNNANGEIGKAFRYIYDVWLPNSEYCLPEELCADFEYYDERWNCQNKAAQMDIYIPIKKMIE